MLGAAIQNGLDQQSPVHKGEIAVGSSTGGSQKRKFEVDSNQPEQRQKQQQEPNSEINDPATKKIRKETAQ